MNIASESKELLFLLNKLQNYPEAECCACMTNTTDHLFLCDHAFHVDCMVQWVKTSNKYGCPTCGAAMKRSSFLVVSELVDAPSKVIMSVEERKMFTDINYQFCPHCDFVVDYYEGCRDLQCPNCRKNFIATIDLPVTSTKFKLGITLMMVIMFIW